MSARSLAALLRIGVLLVLLGYLGRVSNTPPMWWWAAMVVTVLWSALDAGEGPDDD